MKSFKTIALVAGALLIVTHTVKAQVAQPGQSFAFDYPDSERPSIMRFEMQIDGGSWTDIGIPTRTFVDQNTLAGHTTYAQPVPALPTGPHTVAFRACNTSLCGEPSGTLNFTLAVVPAAVPGTPRIVSGE